MAEDEVRHRLVVLGAGQVGKTSIVTRFLKGTFTDSYKATVEDLHCKDYEVNGSLIRVDILDTAGYLEFPAMRRLSISTAHAFLLVYALDNPASFHEVNALWEQIKEQRSNYHDLPCVIVGNKADLQYTGTPLVSREEAMDWVSTEGLNTAFLEVSAKDDQGILNIFKMLHQMANIPAARKLEPLLQRHMSAKESHNSPSRRFRNVSGPCEKNEAKSCGATGVTSRLGRSRSLIRRSSKPKVKHTGDLNRNDCTIS